jgi:hypothetical protein
MRSSTVGTTLPFLNSTQIIQTFATQTQASDTMHLAKVKTDLRASMTPPRHPPPETPTRRALAILGTAVFLLLAPGFFVVLVPYWISHWHFQPAFLGFAPFRVIGQDVRHALWLLRLSYTRYTSKTNVR